MYLRRNQRDVLSELPTLQHTDEWEEPSPADARAYEEAVRSGNFMAMRRAAYARPQQSAKLGRLRELVGEAAENGLKVVVFSAFREVLGAVAEVLDGVHGPLGGGLAPERRQQIVDDFTAAPGHAVLLAQIEAGGIGLNLQAASVVILCEPQLKPTVERQAVARAHRMGQVRPVQVHRLLTTGGLDERLVERSLTKDRLFDAYARRSAVAESTPDAVDVSDVALARRIVAEEQTRLGLASGPGQRRGCPGRRRGSGRPAPDTWWCARVHGCGPGAAPAGGGAPGPPHRLTGSRVHGFAVLQGVRTEAPRSRWCRCRSGSCR
ncbi:hypothetical protein GCM10020256_26150 [Streptomyces thermocoprophilus]